MAGKLLGCFRLKAFKLKSEIHVFRDNSRAKELMHIKARNLIAFSAAYEVSNPETGNILGVWKRNGAMSLFVENWSLVKPDDPNAIFGRLEEDSVKMALLRRYKATRWFVNLFYPSAYRVLSQNGTLLAKFRRSRNPFTPKLYVNLLGNEMVELVSACAVIMVSAGNQAFSPTAASAKFG